MGEVLKCVCQAEASPNASIGWTIEGNDTFPSSFSFVSRNKKNVVSGEISGPTKSQPNISCTATNALGSNTKQLSVDILSKTFSLPMWLSALMLLGTALLFGCAVFIYRKYSRGRPTPEFVCNTNIILRSQILLENVQQEQVYNSPQRSQDEDTQSSPCRPESNPEVDSLCVYDNDFVEEMRRQTRAQPNQNTEAARQRDGEIQPLAKMHEAASGMKWNLPEFLCSITAFTFFSTIYTSSLLLMAVSVVRYIAVAFPITYHTLCRPVYAIVISVVIWLISAAHCSITIIIQHHPSLSRNDTTYCYENFTETQLKVLLPVRLESFFVLCLIPLLICIYCYSRCILILYSRARITQMQKQKAIGMASGTLAVFLICVLPYNISHLLGYFQGKSPQWRYYTLLLSTFNTCIDPIIFYFSSSSFHCTSQKSIFRKRGHNVSDAQKQTTSSS